MCKHAALQPPTILESIQHNGDFRISQGNDDTAGVDVEHLLFDDDFTQVNHPTQLDDDLTQVDDDQTQVSDDDLTQVDSFLTQGNDRLVIHHKVVAIHKNQMKNLHN